MKNKLLNFETAAGVDGLMEPYPMKTKSFIYPILILPYVVSLLESKIRYDVGRRAPPFRFLIPVHISLVAVTPTQFAYML